MGSFLGGFKGSFMDGFTGFTGGLEGTCSRQLYWELLGGFCG